MQHRRFRARWFALALVLAAFSAVAFGQEKIVITHYEVTEQSKLDALAVLIPEFEALYPNYKVEVIHAGYPAFIEQLALLIATGDGPDVLPLGNYLDAGTALDLRPYIERDGYDLEPIMESAIAARPGWHGPNGEIYAIPFGFAVPITIYNRDRFEAQGLAFPTTDWASPGWNWDEFVAAARRTSEDTNGDGINDRFGLDEFSPWYLAAHLWGARYYSDDYTRFTLNSPEGITAFEEMAKLVHEYAVWPRGPLGPPQGNFWGGQMAMRVSGSHELFNSQFMNLDFNYDIAPTPMGTERATYLWIDPLTINGDTEHPEAAWAWLSFITSHENMKRFVVEGHGKIPARNSLVSWFQGLAGTRMPDVALGVLFGASPYDATAHAPFMPPQVGGLLGTLEEQLWLPLIRGDDSAKNLIERLTPVMNARLAEIEW